MNYKRDKTDTKCPLCKKPENTTECQTRATRLRHERYECDTSATLATRVGHEQQECNTSAARVLKERYECGTSATPTTRVRHE